MRQQLLGRAFEDAADRLAFGRTHQPAERAAGAFDQRAEKLVELLFVADLHERGRKLHFLGFAEHIPCFAAPAGLFEFVGVALVIGFELRAVDVVHAVLRSSDMNGRSRAAPAR